MPTITELLAARHADAVFVEECKLGETWGGGARRLDAWVLLKTWSPLTTIGYEIKVERGDFLRDRKWVSYLPVCHELNFVCPPKLIQPEELPAEVGLLWTAGSRLVTKRRAVRREPRVEDLLPLLCYVLMSRTRIVENMWEARKPSKVEFWRAWLEEKNGNRWIGREVSRRLREQLQAARGAQQRAESEVARLDGVRERLRALGLEESAGAWAVDQRFNNGELQRKMARLQQLAAEIQGLCRC